MEESTEQNKVTPPSSAKPSAELKVPRILLEILVIGSKNQESKVMKMLKDIQKQFDTLKSKDQQRARLLWIKDDGTKTKEEMRQWLIDHCYCKYYVFAPETYNVGSDFVKDALKKINALEQALTGIKMFGLVRSDKRRNPSEIQASAPDKSEFPVTPLKIVKE